MDVVRRNLVDRHTRKYLQILSSRNLVSPVHYQSLIVPSYQLGRLREHEQKSSRMYSTDSSKSYGLKQIHGGPLSMIHVGNKKIVNLIQVLEGFGQG